MPTIEARLERERLLLNEMVLRIHGMIADGSELQLSVSTIDNMDTAISHLERAASALITGVDCLLGE